jgi:hypothetical protein
VGCDVWIAARLIAVKLESNHVPVRFIDDPEHWRNRAEEARTLADEMKDQQSRAAIAALMMPSTNPDMLIVHSPKSARFRSVTNRRCRSIIFLAPVSNRLNPVSSSSVALKRIRTLSAI